MTWCGMVVELQQCIVEKSPRHAARIITKERSDNVMVKLKWPLLEERRCNHIRELVKKCVAGYCPQYFKNYFNLIIRYMIG